MKFKGCKYLMFDRTQFFDVKLKPLTMGMGMGFYWER